jgi:hypothetical protein
MSHQAYDQYTDFTTNTTAHSTSSNAFTVYNASCDEIPAPGNVYMSNTGINSPFTTNGFAAWPPGHVNGFSQMSSMVQALTHEQLLAFGNSCYLTAMSRIVALEAERNTFK